MDWGAHVLRVGDRVTAWGRLVQTAWAASLPEGILRLDPWLAPLR